MRYASERPLTQCRNRVLLRPVEQLGQLRCRGQLAVQLGEETKAEQEVLASAKVHRSKGPASGVMPVGLCGIERRRATSTDDGGDVERSLNDVCAR